MLHENSHNRAEERRILSLFAATYGCGFEVCSQGAYPIDAVLKRDGKVVAFCEVRKRSVHSTKYKTLVWSLQKYLHVLQYAEILPTIFVVEYQDGIYWTKIEKKPYEITYVDRSKTTQRTSADNEPCINIPANEFKRLNDRRQNVS